MRAIHSFSRRDFLKTAGSAASLIFVGSSLGGLVGCKRHEYVRPPGEIDLGPVSDMLYTKVHVRARAFMVFRDADGWRALSTRCTYIGCDLTPQDQTHEKPVLFCPCCRSYYDEYGRVFPDQYATKDLPWAEISYRDGHLYANPGHVVPATYRFTTAEIEEAVRALRQRYKEESIGDEVKIPEFLQGQGDGEPGRMFLEDDPNLIHELDMIK